MINPAKRLKPEQMLYVRSMGKLLRVTAIASGMEAANAYMETHKDEGLVAEFGDFCLIANLYDHGTRFNAEEVAHERSR